MDPELSQTLNDMRRENREDFKDIKDKQDAHTRELAVVSERVEGLDKRVVKVESRSMPAKPDHGMSSKTIAGAVIGALALIGGGGYGVQHVKQAGAEERAQDEARERARQETLDAIAKAMLKANKAQAAGAEAMSTLDPQAAEIARQAAREALEEAAKAERAIGDEQ